MGSEQREDLKFVLKIVLKIGGSAFGVILFVFWLCLMIPPRVGYPMQRAKFEELRRSSTAVNIRDSEDVMGQIVEANYNLAGVKTCLDTWWCAWAAAPGWAECERIAIPKREDEGKNEGKEKP